MAANTNLAAAGVSFSFSLDEFSQTETFIMYLRLLFFLAVTAQF